MIKLAIALTGFLAVAAATPPKQNPSTALATVNGESITVQTLVSEFSSRHSGHAKFLGGYGEARSFLRALIDERLFIQEAYNIGLDRDDAVENLVASREREKADARLIRDEIDEKSRVSADEVKAVWKNDLTYFIAVRQIAVQTREEAEEIRRALIGGADFETLARGCSIAESRKNGGHLMVNWGQFGPEWERVVFALTPGELSPVIETTDGFEIVIVGDRLEVPAPPFDRVSAQIESALTQRRMEARKLEFSNELFAKYHVTLAAIDKSPRALAAALATAPDTVIATWEGGGTMTLREVFNDRELRMWAAFPPKRASYEIDNRIRTTINSPLVSLEAKSRRLAELPEIAETIRKYREVAMESALFKGHVLKDVAVTDEDAAKYYAAHKEQFVEPEQRHVAHILLRTQAEANDVRAKLVAGADFAQLARKVSRDAETALFDGKLGWITEEKVPPSFAEVLKLPAGSISKPIHSDHGWHIILVSEVKPKRQMELAEVRDRVRKAAVEAREIEVQNTWLAKLRAAAKIELDDKAIRQFVAENQFDGNAAAAPKHSK